LIVQLSPGFGGMAWAPVGSGYRMLGWGCLVY